jgi:two-component SAPR family response regulator
LLLQASWIIEIKEGAAVIYRKSLTIYVNRCEIVCELPELYEKISEIDNKVRVWFITAYERYDKAVEGVPPKSREIILNHFVEKPIEIGILVKQIKSEID